jgi:hypothetical protein
MTHFLITRSEFINGFPATRQEFVKTGHASHLHDLEVALNCGLWAAEGGNNVNHADSSNLRVS